MSVTMTQMINHAMVLAAGLGKRMRPLTEHRPKPLVAVNDRPLLEYAFDLLREAGVENAVVNTHYLADQLRAYIRDVSDLRLEESNEETLLETGGGIAHALPLLGDEPFFALNSDTICLSGSSAPTLRRMQERWDGEAMDVLLLLMPTQGAVGYHGAGDFALDASEQKLRRRHAQEVSAPYVFTGVQLLKPELFAACPVGAFSMNTIYDRQLNTQGSFDRIGFVVHDGAWLHVGDPEARDAAERFIQARG